MKKRIWALVVTLALCLSLLPMSVLATKGGHKPDTPQPVYVYVQIVDENGTPLQDYNGMHVNGNKDGIWFTVGKIQLEDLQAPSNPGKGGNHYEEFQDEISEALESIERYSDNAGLSLDDVTWTSLHCCDGADDYVPCVSHGGSLTWHLDGIIYESDLEDLKATIT